MTIEEELQMAYAMNRQHVSNRTILMAFIDDLMDAYESAFESLEASYRLIDRQLEDNKEAREALASAFSVQRLLFDAAGARKEQVFEEVAL